MASLASTGGSLLYLPIASRTAASSVPPHRMSACSGNAASMKLTLQKATPLAISHAQKVIGVLQGTQRRGGKTFYKGARLSDLDLYADLLDRSRKLEDLVVC